MYEEWMSTTSWYWTKDSSIKWYTCLLTVKAVIFCDVSYLRFWNLDELLRRMASGSLCLIYISNPRGWWSWCFSHLPQSDPVLPSPSCPASCTHIISLAGKKDALHARKIRFHLFIQVLLICCSLTCHVGRTYSLDIAGMWIFCKVCVSWTALKLCVDGTRRNTCILWVAGKKKCIWL